MKYDGNYRISILKILVLYVKENYFYFSAFEKIKSIYWVRLRKHILVLPDFSEKNEK